MPRRRAEITQAAIKRVVCATVAAGVKVYGVRVDGTAVTVLTEPLPAQEQERTDMDYADAVRERLKALK